MASPILLNPLIKMANVPISGKLNQNNLRTKMKEFCSRCLEVNDGLHIDEWDLCDMCFFELERELQDNGAELLLFSDSDGLFSPYPYLEDE